MNMIRQHSPTMDNEEMALTDITHNRTQGVDMTNQQITLLALK